MSTRGVKEQKLFSSFSALYQLRCPSSYKICFYFYSGENPILGHESRDDYVTLDNIKFIQNTLTNLAPTHSTGPIQLKLAML
jgi:hypothetical protein